MAKLLSVRHRLPYTPRDPPVVAWCKECGGTGYMERDLVVVTADGVRQETMLEACEGCCGIGLTNTFPFLRRAGEPCYLRLDFKR